ncbi:YitT family protein [Peptoniphilus catoniae]|uniref:YitT family protein n=1 Tax=Peptoniphilus catoniae TaxID=1660341 RepID=UPI0010FD1E6D|nr:YitT family protein [Peptoniphilus catoniae]
MNLKLNLDKDILIRKLLAVIVGNFLCATALVIFLKPNNLIPAGVLGMSTLISHVTGISISILILAINLPLVLLGLKFLPKKFMVFSMMSVFVVSFYVGLISKALPVGFKFTDNILLACIFGGSLNGLGMGITLRNGTSTGGFDIIAAFIKSRFNIKIGSILMTINFILITISGFIFSFDEAMFTLIALFVGYQVSDAVQLGVGKQKQVLIVSGKHEDIKNEIYNNMRRGITYIDGEGGYKHNQVKIIFIICSSRELVTVKAIVKKVDPSSFMAVTETSEIMGSGFRKIEI